MRNCVYGALMLMGATSGFCAERIQIIDAHTHTEFTGKIEATSGIPQTREEYFRELEEAGAVGAVAHTESDGSNYLDLRAQGVTHCGGVDAIVDVKRLEAGLKSKRYGCIKIYLGYVAQYANHSNYEPAYKLAQKYDVPVVFHTGDVDDETAKLKYSDPLTVDEVAVDHPKVNFVIAHCGNPWIQSAAEVAYKNHNVYLDGSALLIGDLSRTSAKKIQMFLVEPLAWIFGYIENPRKLMFGSDWPLVNIAAYAEVFKQAIPQEYWKDVFHDNAARVFKITR